MAKFNFFLATTNEHKRLEFQELFDKDLVELKTPSQKLEVLEDGDSFQDNAYKKAKAYYDLLKQPVLSDDSGITVEKLPGELGIHSARFGGDGLNDESRAKLLLEKMKLFANVEDRKAYFTAVLCFYFSPEEVYFFEGRFHGFLANEYSLKGDRFGYDPIFIPDDFISKGVVVSELKEYKMLHSHRAQALKFAQNFLKSKV